MALKVLHTSDWHIGATLADVNRSADFQAFFSWLIDCIQTHQVDVLLIAGDVFDTTFPSAQSQKLYYRFLYDVSQTCVKHVIVTAGNHDSQRFLSASDVLVRQLNVQVAGGELKDQCFILRHDDQTPYLAVAAVPYLREADVRTVDATQAHDDRAQLWLRGVTEHYEKAYEALTHALGQTPQALNVPAIAMGHLFVTGARTGTSEIDASPTGDVYVGDVRQVPAHVFGAHWSYVALGHIHRPQSVYAKTTVRYSGAPLALYYGESEYAHEVTLLTFEGQTLVDFQSIEVPQPRAILRLTGRADQIEARLKSLSPEQAGAIIEVRTPAIEGATGPWIDHIRELAQAHQATVGAIRVQAPSSRVSSTPTNDEPLPTLEDVGPLDVFESVLARSNVPLESRSALKAAFLEVAEVAQRDYELMQAKGQARLSDKALEAMQRSNDSAASHLTDHATS